MALQHSPKALPRHTAPLAPTVQPLPPGTAKLQAKVPEAAEIARHSVVLVVPTKHAAEIAPLDRHGEMPSSRHHAATRLIARLNRLDAV